MGGSRLSAEQIFSQWRLYGKKNAERVIRGEIISPPMPSVPRPPETPKNSPPSEAPTRSSHHQTEISDNVLGISNDERNPCPLTPPELGDSPPKWAIVKAQNWLLARRSAKSDKDRLGVPNTAFGKELKGRDHVFLIDDSFTMRKYWKEATEIVELLAEIIFALKADDEIDIEFVGDSGRCCKKNSANLKKFVESHFPPDGEDRILNVGHALKEYLSKYFKRLDKTSFLDRFKKGRKPLSLYVLTDGCYQSKSDVKTPLIKAIQELERLKKDENFAGVQFIQFGNNLEGGRRLDELDTFARQDGHPR